MTASNVGCCLVSTVLAVTVAQYFVGRGLCVCVCVCVWVGGCVCVTKPTEGKKTYEAEAATTLHVEATTEWHKSGQEQPIDTQPTSRPRHRKQQARQHKEAKPRHVASQTQDTGPTQATPGGKVR